MSKSIKSFSEKILAIVLMIAMLLALFPASAFAKTSAKESQYNWSYSSSGSIDNMKVITDDEIADGTPKNVDEANVAWATQFQLNYYHAISQPTFCLLYTSPSPRD